MRSLCFSGMLLLIAVSVHTRSSDALGADPCVGQALSVYISNTDSDEVWVVDMDGASVVAVIDGSADWSAPALVGFSLRKGWATGARSQFTSENSAILEPLEPYTTGAAAMPTLD